MRILLTSPTYPPFNSGLGNAVYQQANCLAKAGHEVIVATSGKQRTTREANNVRVETFTINGAASLLQPIRGDIQTYIDFLCHGAWDMVLLNAWQNWATDIALNQIENISGRKFVYSHCISTNVFYPHQFLRSCIRYLAWRPYWWRLSGLMRRLDGMLFLAGGGTDSRFDDFRLAKKLAIPLAIIPNNLSPAAENALEKPTQPFLERDRIIAVGSYQWQKGFDFVVKAYAMSDARHRLSLHLYGQRHSSYSAKLKALVRHLGLVDTQVIFHENISGEALLEAYGQAKLVVSGSHTECQPLALIDANATGTPFIARATGCISHMRGGVAIKSINEMAQQLDELTNNKALWESIANKGRQAARDIYHPSQTIRQLLDALTSMPSPIIRQPSTSKRP